MTAHSRNKYRAKPTVIDGIRFASKAEGRRYGELKTMEQAGEITGLELQPKFNCVVNGMKICSYIADFRYFDGNKRVVEDVKSRPTRTPAYRIKKKLVEALYPGVEITEVRA